MRKAPLVLALTLSLALAGAPAAVARACPSSSWFAGTTNICSGVLDYHDYVYDDYGADTGAALTATTGDLSPSAGDQRYPKGEENTADLVELKLWIAGRRLHVWARLNTLYDARSTILALAVGRPGSRGGRWPGLDVSSNGWEHVYELRRGNPRTNVIAGAFAIPRGRVWRVQAVTAQSSGTVMNVAFRGPNELARYGFTASDTPQNLSDLGAWFEDEQAAALRSGDISRFAYRVKVADLRARRTKLMSAEPGLHERVYTSRYSLGEGVSDAGIPGRGRGGGPVAIGFEQSFAYLGHYQPYGIYIPPGAHTYGVQMYYHGTAANFSSQINQPGMQLRFGRQLHRLLVAPLMRGPNGYSSDISERDELDVLADVERNFRIDRGAVFSSGYSQGGYVAYYMAEEHPHVFAGVVDWAGFTGNECNGMPLCQPPFNYTAGAVGNVHDFIPSLLNVPTFMLYSGADELVHVWTARSMDQAFRATPNIFVWYLHPVADHLTYVEADNWSKEAADTRGLRLVRNPVHVVFVRDPVTDSPHYGIRHDGAYWISAIHDRTSSGYGTVDLKNFACGGAVAITKTGNGAGTDPVPWVSHYRKQVALVRLDPLLHVTGTVRNVRSLSINAAATCLSHRKFTYDITTDGPARVAFSDGRALTFPAGGRHIGAL